MAASSCTTRSNASSTWSHPPRDSNAVGTSFTVIGHLVRHIERPEGRVLSGFVNLKRSRHDAPRRRVMARVLGIGGLAVAILAVPAVSGAAQASHLATRAQVGKPAIF